MSTTQALYDGKRIIPFINISYDRNFNRVGNEIIGTSYTITITSKILPGKGSPDSSGVFWTANDYPPDESIPSSQKLESILAKQAALRQLFAANNLGKKFVIIPESLNDEIYFYPNDAQITFSEGPWFNDCDYTIRLTADRVYPDVDGTFNFDIIAASESWSIEPNEQPLGTNTLVPSQTLGAITPFTYRVSHSLSAQGSVNYSGSSVLEAKRWVATRTGVGDILSSGFNNLSGLTAYNHLFSENIDESNNSYSITESWVFSSGNIIEDYSVSTEKTLNGLSQVSIQGNIQGLERRELDNIIENKWENASGYFAVLQPDLFNRAQTISEETLNPIPLTESTGRNPLQGNLTYSYSYDSRPTSLISGALTESISVGYNNSNLAFATVPVINRPQGPVLQSLGTSEAKKKTLNINFGLGPSLNPTGYTKDDFDFPIHLVSGLVDLLDPINDGATLSFYSQPQQSWEPLTGIGSYSIEWTYE